MPERSELEALLGRVMVATGPDREIDAMVAAALHALPDLDREKERLLYPDAVELEANEDGSVDVYAKGESGAMRRTMKRNSVAVTASVDAALALVERCLPGTWDFHLGSVLRGADNGWAASLQEYLRTDAGPEHEAVGRTAPLAILAALLRALIAQSHPAESLKHMPA